MRLVIERKMEVSMVESVESHVTPRLRNFLPVSVCTCTSKHGQKHDKNQTQLSTFWLYKLFKQAMKAYLEAPGVSLSVCALLRACPPPCVSASVCPPPCVSHFMFVPPRLCPSPCVGFVPLRVCPPPCVSSSVRVPLREF